MYTCVSSLEIPCGRADFMPFASKSVPLCNKKIAFNARFFPRNLLDTSQKTEKQSTECFDWTNLDSSTGISKFYDGWITLR